MVRSRETNQDPWVPRTCTRIGISECIEHSRDGPFHQWCKRCGVFRPEYFVGLALSLLTALCLLPVCGRRINNDSSMIELASPHRRPVQRHLEECSHYRALFAQGCFVERQDQVVGVQ
jgi:hypothetical protein